MCEPITLGIATGLAVAGAATSAYSSFKQMQFQEAMGNRASQVSSQAAGEALQRGEATASMTRAKAGGFAGAQKAIAGASGVDVTSGSPAAAQLDTALKSDIDVRTVKNNAAREAWGYETQSQGYAMQASQASAAQGWALAGGGLAAGGSALGGGARVWKSGNQRGWW